MQIKWDDGTVSENSLIEPIPANTAADAFANTADVNPDNEAEIHRTAKVLKVRPEVVRLNPEYAKRMAQAPDISGLESKAPVIAKQLSDESVMSQASDDIENLSTFEQLMRNVKTGLKEGFQFPSQLGEKALALINRGLQPENPNFIPPINLGENIRNIVTGPLQMGFSTAREYYTPSPEERATTTTGKVIEGVAAAPGQIATFMAAGHLLGGSVSAFGILGALDEGVDTEGNIDAGGAIKGGAKGVATGVALEVANYLPKIVSVPAVGALFGTVTALEGGTLSDSVASGVTMSILGLMGHKNPNWREDLTGIKMKELSPETAKRLDAVAQEINGIIDRNPETAKDAINRGVFPQYLQDRIDGKVAAQTKMENMKAVAQAAADSKLRERNPDMFAGIAQAVAHDTEMPTVYLQADDVFERLVKEKGMTPDEVVSWAEQYGETKQNVVSALNTGGKLGFDAGKVLAHLADDKTMALFQDDLHLDPADVPVSKVEGDYAAGVAAVKQIEKLTADAENRTISSDKASDIIASLKAQLKDAGYGGKNADQMLSLLVARANAWAHETGRDASEKLKDFGITVQRTTRAEFEKKYGPINPDAGLPVEPKSNKSEFQSFASMIRRRGGIDPEKAFGMEGEVKSLSQRESGTSGLVRKGGISMDAVLEMAIENRLLPQEATFADVLNLLDEHLRMERTGKLKASRMDARLDPDGPLFQKDIEGFSAVDEHGRPIESVVPAKDDMAGKTIASEIAYWDGVIEKTRAQRAQDPKGFSAVDENGKPIGVVYQGEKKSLVRGALVPGEGKNIIYLFESANLSTFLHEMGHLFLNDLKLTSLRDNVNVEQWVEVKKWLGVKDDSTPLTVKQQERFARGFEAYLREGRAPSASLREAFRSFRRWLTNIYASARRLNVQINDEVRTVFDKMLATDEQIDNMKRIEADVALFTPEEMVKSGATREAVDEYAKAIKASADKARETLDGLKKSGDIAGLRALRSVWRKQANDEAMQTRFYRAMEAITKGYTDKNGAFIEGKGLDKADFIERYGKNMLAKVPKGIWGKDGMPIDRAAVEHGYGSGSEFLKDMASLPSKGEWIQMRVNELEAKHEATPDIQEAIRNAAHRKQLEIESITLNKKYRQAVTDQKKTDLKTLSQSALREWAKRTVDGQQMHKMPSIYNLILTSQSLRRNVQLEASKGKWAKAFDLNEKLRLNEALIAERYRVKGEYEYIQRSWKRMAKSDIAYDYRQQLNQFMKKWGMTDANLQVDAGTKPLSEFLGKLTGDELSDINVAAFSDFALGDAPDVVGRLTWAQVRDVHDVAHFLEGKGYEIKKGILSDKKTSEFDLAADAKKQLTTVKSLGKISDQHPFWRDMQQNVREFLAKHDVLPYLTQWADGFKKVNRNGEPGILERKLFDPIKKGLENKDVLMQQVGRDMEPHHKQIIKTIKDSKGKVFDHVELPDILLEDGRHWTMDKIFAVALNMDNIENIARVANGYNMKIEDMHKLTSVLSDADWKAVQGVWNVIDSLFVKTDEVHLRSNYFRMKKIEPTPLTVRTADGTSLDLDGGYYPAVYDGTLKPMVAEWNEKNDILASNEAIFQVPSAKSQFTKMRSENAPYLPIKLDIGVIYQHLNAVTTYITLSEAVRDFDRVTRNSELQGELKRVMGNERYNMFRPVLKNVLRPEIAQDLGWFLTGTKKLGTLAALTYRTATGLKQLDGMFSIIAEVGAKDFFYYAAKAAMDPVGTFHAITDASVYMKERFGHIDADIARRMADFKPHHTFMGKSWADIQNFGYLQIQIVDTMTTWPGWMAAYAKELKVNGGDIEAAVTAADKVVSRTQGGSSALERAYVTNSKGLYAPFNYFMSNALMYGSRRRYINQAWRSGQLSTSKYLFNVALENVAPPVLTGMMMSYLVNQKPQDAKEVVANVVSYPLRGMIFVRDMSNALQRVLIDDVPAKYAIFSSPTAKPFELAVKTAEAGKEYYDEGEYEKLAWQMADDFSYFSGIPVARVWKDLKKGYEQYSEGEGTPVNILIPSKEKNK